ncbi:hypothetical protein [Klebsiella quasipneumoniae]|uniref:hypothetical protein n=1 Tax=Klebsiella quasipneumoniae TaxID=1463165 RepID=UPI00237CD12F|nr:hypothetical protein [Klebsiella quasipneumoniae]MDE1587372.1 hypothetical protein [Klebsiella quasipneumoniae]MDE1598116.1 hypothetical protein [Klebsiella quasipneumoniae]MDE1603401.1 hypothetical protein [Klebsiella quasipneumoniae]MDE1608699.1 hypothetical protein [Klebsiella quasipneumoniae]MDE1614113.1 hypothetical protein [Klebsiella quasipneumoniae]
MTITLQAVNELIASLESAGELSIREQKFLKLAKAYQQLAAENVGLKDKRVRIFNSGYLRGHESTVEGYYVDIHQDDITTYHEDVVAEISEEQTPATDRIVAGIKADGVEEFIGLLQQHVDEGDFVGDEVAVIVGAIDCGKEFFEQLREGADK